jgi:hypothetical protein
MTFSHSQCNERESYSTRYENCKELCSSVADASGSENFKENVMATVTLQPDLHYRPLGGTGEKVFAIGVGGWHLGLAKVDEALSLRIVRTALDHGINFLDNCWDYNDGASEIRMGKALRDGYRNKAFLMTKIDGRSRSARSLTAPPSTPTGSAKSRSTSRC